MITTDINWPDLAPDIATALLGDPTTQTPREWRYGRKGSLRIDLKKGSYYDFENQIGGGMVDLVCHQRHCDRDSALAWLKDQGFLRNTPKPNKSPTRSLTTPRQSHEKARTEANRAKPTQTPQNSKKAPDSAEKARMVLAHAEPAGNDPLKTYLLGRKVWPPLHPHPPVYWIWNRNCPVWLPKGSAGAAVFHLRSVTGVHACQIEALDDSGRRVPYKDEDRYRRTYGTAKGTVFIANQPVIPEPPPLVVITEGPLDALAAYWMQPWTWALCLATIGTLDKCPLWPLPKNVPIQIMTDGDIAGRRASLLRDRLQTKGWEVSVHHPEHGDPADALARLVETKGWDSLKRKDTRWRSLISRP